MPSVLALRMVIDRFIWKYWKYLPRNNNLEILETEN